MNRSENINELAAALSKAQGIMGTAPKDSKNPFFKSSYADLASILSVAKQPLADNGLSVTQHPGADGNIVSVETTLFHSSGQWMASQLTMLAKDASPQAIGSCITYARRYSVASILGIASEEDDDGNSAQPTKGSPTAKPFSKPTPHAPAPETADPEPVEEGDVAPPSAKRPRKPLEIATAGTRAAALDRLGCQEDGPAKLFLHNYLVALGWLENEKAVENWPIRYVPISAEELEAIKVGLAEFSQSGRAVRPYMPHGLDPETLQAHPVAPPSAAPAPEPEWTKFVMPFGKLKGKTLGQFTPDEMTFYQQFKVEEQPKSTESEAMQIALRVALDEAKATKKG